MGDEEEPQVAGIFGVNFHHSLRQRGDGSDTDADESEEDRNDEMPVVHEKVEQADDYSLSDMPTPSIKESSSFTLDPRATTKTAGFEQQTTSKSFPSRSSLQLATPMMSSPRFAPPLVMLGVIAGAVSLYQILLGLVFVMRPRFRALPHWQQRQLHLARLPHKLRLASLALLGC